MTDNVIPLRVVEVGDGHIVSPESILTEAAGKYATLVLVGETEEGEIQVCGSHGAPDSLLLLAWAQAFIVANKVSR